MTAKRTLLGMVTAAILAIAALLLPVTADAHAGHHGAEPSFAGASVAVLQHHSIALRDTADEDADFDEESRAFLSSADAPGFPAAGSCHAPCCCMAGGMGCASPALGQASSLVAAPWLEKAGRYELIFTVTLADEVEILAGSLVVAEPTSTAVVAARSGWLAALASDARRAVGSRLSERVAGVPSLAIGAAAGFAFGASTILLLRRRRGVTAAMIVLLVMPLATTHAHEGHDHGDGAAAAPAINQAVPQRLADGALFVPKPTQRILAIRTAFTEIATHPTTVELPGRIIPDPNASGYVQASGSGRLSPPPGGFARLGKPVVAGEVLAYVVPPLTAAESAEQRQRQGELDQQIAIIERRIARFEALVRTGAVSRVQLDEARLELAGLRDRRTAIDRVRREPEALIAPVPGRIAAANAIAGQIVETNAVVFHIVDPERLWVEALSFAPLPAAPRQASARDSEGRALTLRHEETGFVDRNQAVVVHLSIACGPASS